MRRLRPHPQAELTDDEVRAAFGFPETLPWVRGSFVATLDGVMRGRDGRSPSVASEADKRVFSMMRSAADVVLIGAGTLRDEDYHPSRLPLAVVTASLHLPMSLRLFALRTSETPRSIILTTAAAAESASDELRAAADVVACGDASVSMATAVRELADRGLLRIHCEGGPQLLGELARAELLDELLLTVTPTLHGGAASEHILDISGGLMPPLSLETTQVLEEDGSVFIRARRRAKEGAA